MNPAALKKAVWMIMTAGSFAVGCGGDVQEAVLTIQPGEHLPCLGVRRIKVTVFKDESSGKSVEVFGEFYQADGSCNLPAGLPTDVSGLPYTGEMSITVEGFDSSLDRRMCLGSMGEVTRKEVQSGNLGEMLLNREPVDDGGVPTYPTGTLTIPPLPGIADIEDMDTLSFIINAGMTGSVNGRFIADPKVSLSDTTLVLSNLLPRDPPNSLIVVAYYKNYPVCMWENTSSFAIGDMFTEVRMTKEQD